MKTSDVARAVTHQPEGALMGFANPAVPVYLLGPGSAGDANTGEGGLQWRSADLYVRLTCLFDLSSAYRGV